MIMMMVIVMMMMMMIEMMMMIVMMIYDDDDGDVDDDVDDDDDRDDGPHLLLSHADPVNGSKHLQEPVLRSQMPIAAAAESISEEMVMVIEIDMVIGIEIDMMMAIDRAVSHAIVTVSHALLNKELKRLSIHLLINLSTQPSTHHPPFIHPSIQLSSYLYWSTPRWHVTGWPG